MSNIADPGQGPQNPPPINPQDGVRLPLAGGAANVDDPTLGDGADGGSGGE